jgi:hypothetical protein
MADIVLTIDPDDTSFALHDRANGRRLMGFDAPVPETDSQWAFSADTEGERRANLRYRNRTITAQVLLDKSTSVLLEALENTLGQKVGKLAREGGELRFAYPTGTTITFNVLEATMNRVFDIADMAKFRARYEISFICEPFGLGTEVDMGDNTETTLPVLIFTETGILGDVPGLGRLVVDNDSSVAQWWLTWGIESRYYSSSANAALFYEAEGRTALGGSAIASVADASPLSPGTNNVIRNTDLLTVYQAILSTQATGGGAHLSHIGIFRVYLRAKASTANTGNVTVAWEWGEGDFLRSTQQNETVLSPPAAATWRMLDMGLVTLRAVASGTQKWEGRVIAKSTVTGDEIDLDYLMLVPVAEGSGVASAVNRDVTPSSYSARDQFVGTTSGNALNARVAPTGGTWATSGDATDYAFADTFAGETYENVSRTTGTVTNGRYAILGSTNYTDTRLEARVSRTGTPTSGQQLTMGLIARWTDSSNYIRAQVMVPSDQALSTLEIRMILAGASTTLASTLIPYTFGTTSSNLANLLRLTVLASGLVTAEFWNPDQTAVVASCSAQYGTLSTGGTLATGKPGLFDFSSSAHERHYSDFFLSVPAADAALFGSQSLEVRHDRVVREDSAGAIWSTVSSYAGDYLQVPPAGAEARTLRAIVKATRGEPDEFDPSIDDISARLFVQPRFLVVPDA